MAARHLPKGRPVHDAEARGIQALVRALPDNYVVFTNLELPTDRPGQTFEHDAIVVAPHAVFTVELKSWGGRIVGNRDRWTLADGTAKQSPIPLILSKARVLKGRLQARRRELGNIWVQGLVFLSAPDASARITPDYQAFVANLDEIRETLTDPSWLEHAKPITPSQRRAIEEYLNDGRPTRVRDELDDHRLLQRLPAEDRPFEAWLAERTTLGRERKIIHTYTIVGETEAERDRLRAHALREATLHSRLRGGPDVLRYDTYFITRDDPQRIVLQFEDTTPLLPMDAWVKERSPGMHARLAVAARVARALAWVHEKNLVHRRLSPEAVLLSTEEMPIEVRLCAFDLARDLTGASPTITGSSLGDPTYRCTAPEVLRTAEATPRSDLFSLGATLVELFTGRALFARVDEVLQPFTVPPLRAGERTCPAAVSELVAELLAVDPTARPPDAAAVATRLEQVLHELTQPPARVELEPGAEIRQTYELVARLGRGATATTWKARQLQTDHLVVLKIAGAEHAATLQEEGRVLAVVHHPNLVRFHNVEPLDDGNLLVLEFVEGVTASEWAAAGDPLDSARFLALGTGLLGALGAMHHAGWVHRDVKPDNVMLTYEAVPKLLDVGLAARWPVDGDLAVGSIRYKDPLVYVDNRWAPTNDLYSAFLVLYELLTGTHPFGGGPPEPGQRPNIQPDEFPDGYDATAVERIAGLFARALSPVAAERPNGVAAAIRELEQAVAPRDRPDRSSLSQRPAAPTSPDLLSADTHLDTPLTDLRLSTRAQGALARLGLTVVSDLMGFDPESVHGLPNVGSKTLRELRALAAELVARWPGHTKAERPPPERFYPPLADDPRPLDALGRELAPAMKEALVARGMFTIGDVAAMPPSALERLESVGPAKLGRLRRALRRLAGREKVPESLAELDAELRTELGEKAWSALTQVVGLRDGRARSVAEAATDAGVSRQRVSQIVDLDPLRADASWAHYLVTVVTDSMPPAGFATVARAAAGLSVRLPSPEGGPSAIGFARLAGLLLRPDARAADGTDLRWVVRPPWTETRLHDLQGRLGPIAMWPPTPRNQAQTRLWDATPMEIQRALVRWGADAASLLDGLLGLDARVLLDRTGRLYTPPVELSAALSELRPGLAPVMDTVMLLAEVETAYHKVDLLNSPGDVDRAIERAGYVRADGKWLDPARVERATHGVAPQVDPTIPTQHITQDHIPPVVSTLASQVARGGFRVVALPPASHHTLGRRLAAWLGELVGPERVSFIPVDRVVLDALKAADLWKFVPYLESQPDADWRLFRAEIHAALTAAVGAATAGHVTVLGQPSLLGPLGLMDWLSGFYDRARGGAHGLIVLAVPGGIHEDRVRLNEKYNLPYTPDMAAVYLDDEQSAA